MNPETICVARYVASHDESVAWYEKLFGRPADARPTPRCQEWRLGADIVFHVIEMPSRQGETSVTFGLSDLDDEAARLWEAGITLDAQSIVGRFAASRYTATCDPEGVSLGILYGAQ